MKLKKKYVQRKQNFYDYGTFPEKPKTELTEETLG